MDETKGLVFIPVLGNIAAGIPIEAIEDILGYAEIPQALAKSGKFFALQVKGDSMEPGLSQGDIVIIRRQKHCTNGDIVAVLIGNEETLLKRITKNQKGAILASDNPRYEPIFFTNQEILDYPVVILGKLVEVRKSF